MVGDIQYDIIHIPSQTDISAVKHKSHIHTSKDDKVDDDLVEHGAMTNPMVMMMMMMMICMYYGHNTLLISALCAIPPAFCHSLRTGVSASVAFSVAAYFSPCRRD